MACVMVRRRTQCHPPKCAVVSVSLLKERIQPRVNFAPTRPEPLVAVGGCEHQRGSTAQRRVDTAVAVEPRPHGSLVASANRVDEIFSEFSTSRIHVSAKAGRPLSRQEEELLEAADLAERMSQWDAAEQAAQQQHRAEERSRSHSGGSGSGTGSGPASLGSASSSWW